VGTANVFDADASQELFGKSSTNMIRPEQVQLGNKGDVATITETIYLGSTIRFILDLHGHQIIAEVSASNDEAKTYRRGSTVKVTMSKTDLVELP
jgi:ABC-type Fe3+/spermidine/putrescine transport system ATPase subunit